MWITSLIFLIVGMILGAAMAPIIIWIGVKKHSVGTLRVDNSIPEDEPYLFLELKSSVDKVKTMKYVILDVNATNYLSQK